MIVNDFAGDGTACSVFPLKRISAPASMRALQVYLGKIYFARGYKKVKCAHANIDTRAYNLYNVRSTSHRNGTDICFFTVS